MARTKMPVRVNLRTALSAVTTTAMMARIVIWWLLTYWPKILKVLCPNGVIECDPSDWIVWNMIPPSSSIMARENVVSVTRGQPAIRSPVTTSP